MKRMMDTPLTKEERLFAEDINNHNQLFKYMKIHKLNQEEWYDILILHYLRAVRKYLTISKLKEYEFPAILFRTLDNARSNYFRDMNRQKRRPEGGVFSYDALLDDETTFETYITDVYTNVERQVIIKELCKEFYYKCIHCEEWQTDIRKTELDMLLDGYTLNQIVKETLKKHGGCNDEGLCSWALDNDIEKFRKIFKQVFGI